MQFLMMHMSHAGMEMQSLFMMVLVRICIPCYKCLLVGMPWCKCSKIQIIQKFPLFSKSRLFRCLKPTYFQILIYYSQKVIFFFLKALEENWWLLLEISGWDINSKIWWSDSKDLFFSQFGWAKGWHISKAFFWKKNEFFKNQAS